MFECWGSISTSGGRIDIFTNDNDYRIQYTSSDGINFTRTDGGDEYIDFGCNVFSEAVMYGEEWNELLGYFIRTGGYDFGGVYQYGAVTDKQKIVVVDGITYYMPDDFVKRFSNTSEYIAGVRPFYDGSNVVNILEYDENNVITKFDQYVSGGGIGIVEVRLSDRSVMAAQTRMSLAYIHYDNGELSGQFYATVHPQYADWSPENDFEFLPLSSTDKAKILFDVTPNTKWHL